MGSEISSVLAPLGLLLHNSTCGVLAPGCHSGTSTRLQSTSDSATQTNNNTSTASKDSVTLSNSQTPPPTAPTISVPPTNTPVSTFSASIYNSSSNSSDATQFPPTSTVTVSSNGTLQNNSTSHVPPGESAPTSQSPSTGTYVLHTTPSPGDSALIPTTTQSGPASILPAPAAVAASNKHSDHTGAIVGGVLGGLAFLLLATVVAILYRRMRAARRTAPSAEFMDIVRGTTPGPVPASGAMRAEGTTTPSGDRLLGLEVGDDERPPVFISGAYGDPVFEKVQAAAAMREQYQRRDSYAAAQVEYEGEKSDVGHENESTEVGTEEGYGFDGDEKAGYTWAM